MPLPHDLLEKSAAEAAAYLAETEAKVRKEGPLEKSATLDLRALLQDEHVQQVLRNAAIGAGVGGVGGLALGSFGSRKKSPWSTAATGALLGAGIGGLGTVAHQQLGEINTPDTAADKARQVQTYLQEPYLNKLYDSALNQVPDDPRLKDHTLYNLLVRGPKSFPTAEPPKATGGVGQTAEGAAALAHTGWDYAQYHPHSVAESAALLAAPRLYGSQQNRVNDFLAGAEHIRPELKSNPLADRALLDAQNRVRAENARLFGGFRGNRQLSRELRHSAPAAGLVRNAVGANVKAPRTPGRLGQLSAAAALANLLYGAYAGR